MYCSYAAGSLAISSITLISYSFFRRFSRNYKWCTVCHWTIATKMMVAIAEIK